MRSVIRLSQVIALVALAACGARSPESAPNPEGQAMLQVENQDFNDMVVYAVNGGQRIRLGLATGNTTKTFTIPSYLVRGAAGPMRFLADPIGGRRAPVSDEMTVRPGDIVTLTIPPQ